MITYNWDLALKMLIGYFFLIGILSTLFGLFEVERTHQYTWKDAVTGLLLIVFLSVPAFY